MDPFYAEIRAFAFNYAPQGWAACDGASVPIMQNQAVYALIGVTFGGDSKTVFNLPNLQGCAPIHWTNTSNNLPPMSIPVAWGATTGVETVTLAEAQMPSHTHQMIAGAGTVAQLGNTPGANSLPSRPMVPTGSTTATFNAWQNTGAPDTTMAAAAIGSAYGAGGVTQAHENRQPYLPLLFCICLENGIWPEKP